MQGLQTLRAQLQRLFPSQRSLSVQSSEPSAEPTVPSSTFRSSPLTAIPTSPSQSRRQPKRPSTPVPRTYNPTSSAMPLPKPPPSASNTVPLAPVPVRPLRTTLESHSSPLLHHQHPVHSTTHIPPSTLPPPPPPPVPSGTITSNDISRVPDDGRMPDRPRQSPRSSPSNLRSVSPGVTHQLRLVDLVYPDSRPTESFTPTPSTVRADSNSSIPFPLPPPPLLSTSSTPSATSPTNSTTTTSSVATSTSMSPSRSTTLAASNSLHCTGQFVTSLPTSTHPPNSSPTPLHVSSLSSNATSASASFPSTETPPVLPSSLPFNPPISSYSPRVFASAVPVDLSSHMAPSTPTSNELLPCVPATYPPTTIARSTFPEPESYLSTDHRLISEKTSLSRNTMSSTTLRKDIVARNNAKGPISPRQDLASATTVTFETLPELEGSTSQNAQAFTKDSGPSTIATFSSLEIPPTDNEATPGRVAGSSHGPHSPVPTSPKPQSPTPSRHSLPMFGPQSLDELPSLSNMSTATSGKRDVRRCPSPVSKLRFAKMSTRHATSPTVHPAGSASASTSPRHIAPYASLPPIPQVVETTRRFNSDILDAHDMSTKASAHENQRLRLVDDTGISEQPFFVSPSISKRHGVSLVEGGSARARSKPAAKQGWLNNEFEPLVGQNPHDEPSIDDSRSLAASFVNVGLAPTPGEVYNEAGSRHGYGNDPTGNGTGFSQRVRQHRRHTTSYKVVRRARQLSQNLRAASSGPQTLSALQAISAFTSSGTHQLACLERQEALDDVGVLQKLVEIQRLYLSHGPIQTIVCSIVGTLSLDDSLPLARFDAEALLETTLASMRIHWNDSDVMRESLRALDSLSRLERIRKDSLPSTGVIIVVGRCLHHHTHDAAIIFGAIRFFGQAVISCHENKIEVVSCGALNSIINAAQTHSSNLLLQAHLCLTLRNLCIGYEHDQSQMPKSSSMALSHAVGSVAPTMIGALLDAMMSHGHAYTVASHALAALFHLTHAHNQTRHIVRHDLWEHALVDTASRHVTKATLQIMALAVISKVVEAGGPYAAKRLLRVGAVRLALTSMHRFVNRRAVLFYGALLVRSILQAVGDGIEEIRACGGVERLLDILYSAIVTPVCTEEPFAGYGYADP